MPRGRVIKRSLEEQISMVEEDIRTAQNKVNKLQEKLKELQKQKREEDMEGLYSLIKESGLSMEEIRHRIAPDSAQKETESKHTADIA